MWVRESLWVRLEEGVGVCCYGVMFVQMDEWK